MLFHPPVALHLKECRRTPVSLFDFDILVGVKVKVPVLRPPRDAEVPSDPKHSFVQENLKIR